MLFPAVSSAREQFVEKQCFKTSRTAHPGACISLTVVTRSRKSAQSIWSVFSWRLGNENTRVLIDCFDTCVNYCHRGAVQLLVLT